MGETQFLTPFTFPHTTPLPVTIVFPFSKLSLSLPLCHSPFVTHCLVPRLCHSPLPVPCHSLGSPFPLELPWCRHRYQTRGTAAAGIAARPQRGPLSLSSSSPSSSSSPPPPPQRLIPILQPSFPPPTPLYQHSQHIAKRRNFWKGCEGSSTKGGPY